MIFAYQKNDPILFRRIFREMLVHTLVVSCVFALVSSLVLPYLLEWLNKEVYFNNYYLFYWLLLATALNALGMIPHYAVYAQKQDLPIIQSHLVALPVFIVTTSILSFSAPFLAVPIALCVSQLFIIIWKTKAYIQCTPDSFLRAQ